jgi:hypothetical protein
MLLVALVLASTATYAQAQVDDRVVRGDTDAARALGVGVDRQDQSPTLMRADGDAPPMELLFAQNAHGISFDSETATLTLIGVSPVVTFFSDRPYRTAGHVLLSGFIQLWDEGRDSFKADPPNASLSVFDGTDVQSVVLEIADPKVDGDRLSYRVVRVLDGELPATGGICSLFIDGLFGRGLMRGGIRGAATGGLIGAMAGDAGKGAAIGAGVGVVGGAVRGRRDREAAAQEQATTRVVYVANANGSRTPVSLHLVVDGWQGPQGEIYPTLPSPEQLQKPYGLE